jgi:hypothetical protein
MNEKEFEEFAWLYSAFIPDEAAEIEDEDDPDELTLFGLVAEAVSLHHSRLGVLDSN